MSRSKLQASMGFTTPYIYECDRDGHITRGTAPEIAEAVGRSVSWVRDHARAGRPSAEGWIVKYLSRIPQIKRRARIYVAERKNDDSVIGDSEEIASILGYSAWYIRSLSQTGAVTRAGWRVREATPEEAEAARGA